MNLILDEKGKAEISFNDLAASCSEEAAGGTKSVHDITHTDLIMSIQEIISNSGIDSKLNPIFISNGGERTSPGITYIPGMDASKSKDIGAHVIRRFITSFEMDQGSNDLSNSKLALSFCQNGIVAAIGANVRICSNLSIFGYDNIVSTRGTSKVDNIASFLDVIRGWFTRYDEMRERDQRIIERMQNTTVTNDEIIHMIGDLNIKRILKDDFRKIQHYPFNQTNINTLTKEIIRERDNFLQNDPESEYETSIWNLYNIGTALQNPNNVDIPNIIIQNVEWGNFLIEKFHLN